MIEITENINIDASINVIWAFLTDLSKSLSYNRFHNSLKLPTNYSIGKMKKFKIIHNFGFGNYEMVAKIIECQPPNTLSISEYCKNQKDKGFPHTIQFHISPNKDKSILFYTVKGTYGGRVQNISFMPILKGVMIEELLKIKSAIESSQKTPEPISSKSIKPI